MEDAMIPTEKELAIKLIKEGNLLDAAELLVKLNGDPVKNQKDVLPYLKKWMFRKVEYFLVVTLDAQNKVIQVHEVAKGTVNTVRAWARDIFRAAIIDNAASIILAHNHPSGSLVFSKEDKKLTRDFVKVGKLVGIPVLDHLIVGYNQCASAAEEGLLGGYVKDII
jgi:DNA repair protein RadC